MSVDTKQEKQQANPFGSAKVTQAEVAQFVQFRVQPLIQKLQILQNAIDTLYMFLGEVGLNGARITQEEIVAFVKSKNNQTAGQAKENGTNT